MMKDTYLIVRQYIDKALEEWGNGFSSKASKKRSLANLNNAYESLERKIRDSLLTVSIKDRTTTTWESLYWGLPQNLYKWKPNHSNTFSVEGFVNEVKQIESLIEYREAIKSTEIVPPFKTESPEQKKQDEIELYLDVLQRRFDDKFIEGVELADKFGGLDVTVNGHWVTNQHGTLFARHFFYLFGKLTALNTIISIAIQHKNNKKGA